MSAGRQAGNTKKGREERKRTAGSSMPLVHLLPSASFLNLPTFLPSSSREELTSFSVFAVGTRLRLHLLCACADASRI